MWLDSLVAGAGALSSLSWSLACPYHCGPSLSLPVLLGFFCGVLSGLLLAFGLWVSFCQPLDFAPSPVPSESGLVGHLRRRSSSRVRGYLHE